jgi:hypothetical protein
MRVPAQVIILRIIVQPADPDDFRRQVDLIKASGAQYDSGSKTWQHTLTSDSLRASTLNPLFQAAMEYRTLIEASEANPVTDD